MNPWMSGRLDMDWFKSPCYQPQNWRGARLSLVQVYHGSDICIVRHQAYRGARLLCYGEVCKWIHLKKGTSRVPRYRELAPKEGAPVDVTIEAEEKDTTKKAE